jgi:hypothetical protein
MKPKLLSSSLFALATALTIWALASVSAQVRVPDIPRVPVAPQMPPTIPHDPNINGPTIVHTPPPIETEPPHFHPHHGGHADLVTPQPTIAPYFPPR